MPKDASKNVDRYKIKGGTLNEFDFHQAQEEVATKGAKSTKSTKTIKPTKSTKKPAAHKTSKK
ncbi:MAG TPA: hypothetical protein VEV42_19010 [Pyrinomonadaceae bacterium]|nr:hypothetical protein [Pyrinomonadaceae bacterium]